MTACTVTFTRIETNWLYQQMESARGRASALLSEKPDDQEARMYSDELEAICMKLKDQMTAGERQRAKLSYMKEELEEARELVGEDEKALEEISNRLSNLPKEEPYLMTFDRPTVKFIVKIVENDLQNFRAHIIPKYEKANDSDFTDAVQTKTFWVNKARKSKTILEQLKQKLERVL